MRAESTPGARGPVFCGVDTHADSHWLCVLDWRGRKILSRQFPADAAGYEALAGAIAAAGEPACVAMEGTSSYGAGLTRHLASLGVPVREALSPARMQRRRPGQGKCDAGGRVGPRGGKARGEGQPGAGGFDTRYQREVHLDAGEGPKGPEANKEGLRGVGRGGAPARLGQAGVRGRAQNGF